jgi:hypothetical protein
MRGRHLLRQLRAGVEALLYEAKYSSLHEAVQLIADRLAAADRQNYVEADAAIDDARKQLLQALFEGAVRAEGVRWYNVAPDYEGPSVEYNKWTSIDRGIGRMRDARNKRLAIASIQLPFTGMMTG